MSNPLWKWLFHIFVARSMWQIAKTTIEAVYTFLATAWVMSNTPMTTYTSFDWRLSLLNGWFITMSYLSILAFWLSLWLGTSAMVWFFYQKLPTPKANT